MRTFTLPAIVFSALLADCMSMAYPPQPRNFDRGTEALSRGEFDTAYRFLEQPTPGTEAHVINLMQQHPRIVEAGKTTFTEAALLDSIARYGKPQAFKIEHSRLQRFAVYASPNMFQAAAEAVALVFANELAAHHAKEAEHARIAKLPQAEQEQYWAERFQRGVDAATVRGTIMSTQLIDRSRQGTSTGAGIGSAIGQSIYIDSTSWRNYRATSQLAAGVLGAIIGSSIDRRPTTSFQKVYFIRTKDGEVRRIEEQTSDPVLLPVGACLEYREPFHLTIVSDVACRPKPAP